MVAGEMSLLPAKSLQQLQQSPPVQPAALSHVHRGGRKVQGEEQSEVQAAGGLRKHGMSNLEGFSLSGQRYMGSRSWLIFWFWEFRKDMRMVERCFGWILWMDLSVYRIYQHFIHDLGKWKSWCHLHNGCLHGTYHHWIWLTILHIICMISWYPPKPNVTISSL